MKRGHFLLTAFMSIPAVSLAWIKNLTRTDKGFKVAAGKNRMDSNIKYSSVGGNYLKISQADTNGD